MRCKECYHLFVTTLCLPNEDFGKRNSALGVSFRGTLRGCEYSIWAMNPRKVPRNDTPNALFRFPKSSFGEHKLYAPQTRRMPPMWEETLARNTQAVFCKKRYESSRMQLIPFLDNLHFDDFVKKCLPKSSFGTGVCHSSPFFGQSPPIGANISSKNAFQNLRLEQACATLRHLLDNLPPLGRTFRRTLTCIYGLRFRRNVRPNGGRVSNKWRGAAHAWFGTHKRCKMITKDSSSM